MSPDPNSDLIGTTFPVDTGGVGVVTGTAPWSSQYVLVSTDAGPTCRPSAVVRRGKELA